MYACAFAEFISHGMFDISTNMFNATNHHMRYGALLWDYARKKQNDGTISKSEVTGNVTSGLGGPKMSRPRLTDRADPYAILSSQENPYYPTKNMQKTSIFKKR